MGEVRRVVLIRHGATAAVRAAAFGGVEPLQAAACHRARELAGSLPSVAGTVAGPEPACRQTAVCLGSQAEIVAGLAGCDVGRWRGSTLDELERQDPAGLMAWLSDPDATPHGGESLSDFTRRVAALDGHGGSRRRTPHRGRGRRCREGGSLHRPRRAAERVLARGCRSTDRDRAARARRALDGAARQRGAGAPRGNQISCPLTSSGGSR